MAYDKKEFLLKLCSFVLLLLLYAPQIYMILFFTLCYLTINSLFLDDQASQRCHKVDKETTGEEKPEYSAVRCYGEYLIILYIQVLFWHFNYSTVCCSRNIYTLACCFIFLVSISNVNYKYLHFYMELYIYELILTSRCNTYRVHTISWQDNETFSKLSIQSWNGGYIVQSLQDIHFGILSPCSFKSFLQLS